MVEILMANLDHIMPNPQVVPIFWGSDYLTNPNTVLAVQQMILDLVTGPFMNGLGYGVARARMLPPVIIPDQETPPPATITYKDSNNNLVDQITPTLIGWINAGSVPPPPSPSDINQLYLIFPPPETTFQTYNSKPNNPDPIGNGVQGMHNEGVTKPSPPPTYYWAIVKTNDVGSPTNCQQFASNLAQIVSHELVEQFVDRNGSFAELGDACFPDSQGIDHYENYRGWQVQQYLSTWDSTATQCLNQSLCLYQRR
jgi:hypothetical protein